MNKTWNPCQIKYPNTLDFWVLVLKVDSNCLQSKADAFEYADQVLERWYPSIEEGGNKGIVVLVTSQKEGAVTGGPAFVQAVGENILDATVSENLPGNFAFCISSLWTLYYISLIYIVPFISLASLSF